MINWPCDQLAADIISVQEDIYKESGVLIPLSSFLSAEQMIEEAEAMFSSGTADGYMEVLEAVLQGQMFQNDREERAHRKLLGKFFSRRWRWRAEQNDIRGRNAPFVPQEEEQDS